MASILSKVYPTAVEATSQARFTSSDESIDRPIDDANTKAIERRILMKCDLRILPILFLLFLVSFVDRTNIGNAKIEGLERSLNMVGNQYNIALFVFNIPYVLLDVPSNLALRKLNPAPWLASMMFCWGKPFVSAKW